MEGASLTPGDGAAAGRRVDAVVFDLFGTLVPEFTKEGFFGTVEEAARRLGVDVAAFREAWVASAPERQTGGWGSVEDGVRAICRAIGAPEPTDEAVAHALEPRIEMYARDFRPRPGALETLAEVKARGYPIALISMCAPDTPGLWRASPMAALVDVEVFSCETGLRKPDPAIFRAACDRLGVAPERCLYVGDGAYGELTGARAVGMTAYLVRDPELDPDDALRPEPELAWDGPAVDDLRELLDVLP
ncbi:MAG TPA: HAD family hydrolase [Actinomycetota bacterium]